MFVVIFEVEPKAERWSDYLQTAKLLRPELERIDGFIDNERFGSERTHGKVLSLSTWRDEKALIRWRTQATHHTVGQRRGRFEIFADYRLRVGEVTADTHLPAETELCERRFDETEVGVAKAVTITEIPPHRGNQGRLETPGSDTPGLVDCEWFEHLAAPDRRLLLGAWTDAQAAAAWPSKFSMPELRHRRVRIIRDYGMRERYEAPQYFPDVA